MQYWRSITVSISTHLIFRYHLPLKGLSYDIDFENGAPWLSLYCSVAQYGAAWLRMMRRSSVGSASACCSIHLIVKNLDIKTL